MDLEQRLANLLVEIVDHGLRVLIDEQSSRSYQFRRRSLAVGQDAHCRDYPGSESR